jgi:DNA-binding response OmpR family regulator
MKTHNISELDDLSELKVLIIDDNLHTHEILKESLNALGMDSIHSAQNAFDALQLCDEADFHIIICAFNVKSDKDGFHLFEELKFKRHITKTTVVIFLSSETDESLVNSILELQPDDFWVKPLLPESVKSRFMHTLQIKKQLFNVYEAIDNGAFSKALYFADRHLADEQLVAYHPTLLRMKGETLLDLRDFGGAELFYRNLLNQHKHAWVYLGYVQSLLKQGRIDEISELLARLSTKTETRFGTHDMLAQYYMETQHYRRAYTEIKKATILAPRNIERNRRSLELARLNHDYVGQYKVTKNIALYAKNSIHDSPQLQLNVIRAAIDLVCATTDGNPINILQKAEVQIQSLEKDEQIVELFSQQIQIVKARLHNVRGEKDIAEIILGNPLALATSAVLDDNLDKAKVLHELGRREEALELLKEIKQQISGDSFSSQVVKKYVEQETAEREKIYFTPKQLNTMAVAFYRKQRMRPALNAIQQALTLTPNNIKLTMRLFKILIVIKRRDELARDHDTLALNTIKSLQSSKLKGKASFLFQNMKVEWDQDRIA